MSLLDPAIWSGRLFIDGWEPGGAGEYPVVEPATGAHLETLGAASVDDVRRAAERAAAAQVAWAAAPYGERAAVLRRAAQIFAEQSEEISGWLVREAGSIPGKAAFEIASAESICHEASALASLPYGEVLRSSQPRLSLSRRLPVGVVGVIAPFNVPIILSLRAVAPALALGNAVVLKPDARTAVSGGVVLARVFEEAGLPPGLLCMLPGGADIGEALVTDPRTRVIAFTGSTRAGRAVGMLCAQHLKRAHLELGGNSALVILDDVDLERAASIGAWGSFFHQGQVCMTSERHLVASSVVEQYTALLAKHAEALPVGDPASGHVALGPIIDASQRDKIHSIVNDTVAAGARLVTGGTFEDLFYRPTVLADVPTSSRAFTEEIFGPVAPIVAFDSLDEAASLAADTPYGLSLGILTGDVTKALALAERIPSGAVHINDQTINDEMVNPFGGVGDSGSGRIGGPEANLESFTDVQWVTIRGELASYPF
ncbi:MAG TPA: aldehyde dehydrogenase family protein [Acidimicrobiales bacterium]|nr:aldehyde dehydrogenase family protein [Acidimicrobiales bacterium]